MIFVRLLALMRWLRIQRQGMVWSLVVAFYTGHAQTDEGAVQAVLEHRKKTEAEFRDPAQTPLGPKDLKQFKGLNYYPVDLRYRVKAVFVKNETPVFFRMKTTTERLPEYITYGTVSFSLEGNDFVLEVYQSPEISRRPGYEDYLFIPFTDETNGKETYDVGRYLEFRIPPSPEVILDFNVCYNPYCSYSDRFSCPIPPAANYLPIEIKAGEKYFKKH